MTAWKTAVLDEPQMQRPAMLSTSKAQLQVEMRITGTLRLEGLRPNCTETRCSPVGAMSPCCGGNVEWRAAQGPRLVVVGAVIES